MFVPLKALGLLLLLGFAGCAQDSTDSMTPDAELLAADGTVTDSATDDSDVEVAPTVGWIEIGEGEDEFSFLPSPGEAYVIRGPQGGFHMLGSVRSGDFEPGNPEDLEDPTNPLTEFSVYLGERRVDADVANFRQALRSAFGTTDVYEMVGRFVILAIEDDDELVGQTVQLRVKVTDHNGAVYRDTRDLLAVKHPNNDLPP